MSRALILVATIACTACGLWPSLQDSCSDESSCADVMAAQVSPQNVVPGEYLVKVGNSSDVERFIAERGSVSGVYVVRRAVSSVESGEWHSVHVPPATLPPVFLRHAMKTQGVLAVEPNRIFESHLGPGFPNPPVTPVPTRTPNPDIGGPDYRPIPVVETPVPDARRAEQWGLDKSQFPRAWETQSSAGNVVIASIDSGADYNHPDLSANLWNNPGEIGTDERGQDKRTNGLDDDGNGFVDDVVGYDFRDLDARPFDENGHGTHTAGIMGAVCDNGIGICGAARKTQVMILRFTGGRAFRGTSESALASLQYALDNGAQILSNSWGGRVFSQAIFDTLANAAAKDVLVIASAGNETISLDNTPVYPASYALPNVIAVAATDRDDKLASFSSFGKRTVHLAAPGSEILSLLPGGRYEMYNGTSMSVPLVSATAALLKAGWPKLGADEIKALILDSVDNVPALSDQVETSGRLNAARALQLARERFGQPAH